MPLLIKLHRLACQSRPALCSYVCYIA